MIVTGSDPILESRGVSLSRVAGSDKILVKVDTQDLRFELKDLGFHWCESIGTIEFAVISKELNDEYRTGYRIIRSTEIWVYVSST